ncbi:MAG: ATP-dependent 6-phosphofructokinase [Thermodesulfobacteriota bacterium]|nr:ATP-dependent 6-phosphofructokinase [Thermodesulfobacteriota bacterium]
MNNNIETKIENLGIPKIPSPLKYKNFVSDDKKVIIDPTLTYYNKCKKDGTEPVTLELSGPREKIYFEPKKVKCAIVTCGGLCPGINNVVRAIVLELYYMYGVKNIQGIKYGYQGLIPEFGHELVELNPEMVVHINELGGSVLVSSRGLYDISEIVDSLERLNINILFTIGGDGTLRGALKITEEILKRGYKCGVIGIPKTIDNDINLLAKSFGFQTAVEIASKVITSAHTEALGAPNGIGLVKLMGRHSGFIAANAALAQREVNFVLIPELDFDLEGEAGFLNSLKKRIVERKHAVIVVAEGAGQKFFNPSKLGKDASGNQKLGDIGNFLKDKINAYFKRENISINLKYIDPSYMIRSVPANSNDSIFCGFLGQNAVHAGMAGKTGMIVGIWNNLYINIPIKSAISKRKQIHLDDNLWLSVLESTGQPPFKG